MQAKLKIKIFLLILLLTEINYALALPMDNSGDLIKTEAPASVPTEVVDESSSTAEKIQPESTLNETKPTQESELEATEGDQREPTTVGPTGTDETSDNEAAASNFDPSVYGGLITPDAFQQYVNQFGGAFPYAAPYPAPVYAGYMPPPPPPVYPSPYVVQTGYEGYLVPTKTDSSTPGAAGDASSTQTSPQLHPFAVLSNIISTLMMSTIFRIIAGIVSTLGMVFFSGAIVNFMCNYTPLCDMSFRAVTYLRRRDNAERMGRMIAEGMTPERVKRAAEFVQNAIKLYEKLQETTTAISEHMDQ